MPAERTLAVPQQRSWTVILREEDTIARTGERCPTSGAWTAPAQPSAAVVLLKGELMPSLCGETVEWKYTAELNPLRALDLESAMQQGSQHRQPAVLADRGKRQMNGREQSREIEVAFPSKER